MIRQIDQTNFYIKIIFSIMGHDSVCLFVCLFVGFFFWSFSSDSRIFHSYGDVTIAGEGLHNLIYARHSWSLSSKVR